MRSSYKHVVCVSTGPGAHLESQTLNSALAPPALAGDLAHLCPAFLHKCSGFAMWDQTDRVIHLDSVPHPRQQFMPNSLEKKILLKISRAILVKSGKMGH